MKELANTPPLLESNALLDIFDNALKKPREKTMTTPIKRRSLLKGAAWTAPTVLTAARAPAYAASLTCHSINLTPGSVPGVFTLSFDQGLERLMITLQQGTFDAAVFAPPYWYLTSDQKTAYFIPELIAPDTSGAIHLDLKILPDEEDFITAVINFVGCSTLTYKG